MRKILTASLVFFIMVVGVLGITNPAFKQTYSLFDSAEGTLTNNNFIYSLYRQHNSDIKTKDGKFIIYRRFIGIAMNFYEISAVQVENK